MIVIVDFGMGNLGSIRNMLKKLGATAQISADPAELERAEKIILPGVGAFDTAMASLERLNLLPVLNEKVVVRKTPVIGVCLGMQLLTNSSEEGQLPGLGWIDARTIKFQFADSKLKVPHMGWNTVSVAQDTPLFADMYEEPRFYFVHSYHVQCANSEDVLTTTTHGIEFASSVNRGNIWGAQYHPEKSHKYGLKLYSNFLERC